MEFRWFMDLMEFWYFVDNQLNYSVLNHFFLTLVNENALFHCTSTIILSIFLCPSKCEKWELDTWPRFNVSSINTWIYINKMYFGGKIASLYMKSIFDYVVHSTKYTKILAWELLGLSAISFNAKTAIFNE